MAGGGTSQRFRVWAKAPYNRELHGWDVSDTDFPILCYGRGVAKAVVEILQQKGGVDLRVERREADGSWSIVDHRNISEWFGKK